MTEIVFSSIDISMVYFCILGAVKTVDGCQKRCHIFGAAYKKYEYTREFLNVNMLQF